jgi:hypothetical protein
MHLSETSKTVASARLVVVDGIEMASGFPLSAPDGSAAAPSYSFSEDTGAGLLVDTTGSMSMSVGGVVSWAASSGSNVSLAGGPPTSFGGGSGVVHLSEVGTTPSSAPNGGSGGALYVSGPSLFFTNNLGVNVNLTSLSGDLSGPGSSTDDRAALFSDATGKNIKNSTLFLDAANSSVQSAAGSAGAPPFSFGSDASTGMYNSGVNQLGFSTEGVLRMDVTSTEVVFSTPLLLPSGSAAAPGLAISDGGVYASGNSVVIANDGVPGLVVSPGPNVAIGGAVPTNYASGVGVTLLHQVSSAPTTASTGGISVYTEGTAVKGMTTAGVVLDFTSCLEGAAASTDTALARFSGVDGDLLQDSSVLVAGTGEVSAPAGTASLPTYTFSGDTGTGLYRVEADTLGISTSGVNRLTLEDTGETLASVRLRFDDGLVGAPSMAYTSGSTTGMYTDGTNTIFVGDGKPGLVVSPNLNVSLAGGVAASYGGGEGVMFLNQAVVDPTTNVTSAGLLYVPVGDVELLRFRDTAGTVTDVNGSIVGPASSTDRAVARWDGASGRLIQNSSVTVSAAGNMLVADGSAGTPSYSIVGDTDTGLFSAGADSLGVSLGGVLELSVSSVVALTQVLDIPVGVVGAPSLSFASDTTTGLFHPSANTVSFVGGGAAGMAVTLISGGTNPNITLCSGTLGYGGTTEGERLVKIDDVAVAPSGAAAGGGRLYVSGTTLNFHAASGGIVDLLDITAGPGSSTDGGMVRWDGVSGALVQDSGVLIGGSGTTVEPPTATAAAPSLSFTSATDAGVYFPSSTSIGVATDGVERLSVSASAVTTNVLYADAGVEIGGAAGVNYSLSVANFISDVQSASGTFTWSNSSSTIMSTSGLDLSFANNLVFTEGTETFSVGHDGTDYVFDSAGTSPDDIAVSVGGADVLQIPETGDILPIVDVVVSGRCVATSSSVDPNEYVYSTSVANNNGMHRFDNGNVQLSAGGGVALEGLADNNVMIGRKITDNASGEAVFGMSYVATLPTLGGANQITLFTTTTTSAPHGAGAIDASNTLSLCDAGRVRASISITTSVSAASTLNTDDLTWTEVDEYGVSGTTTGRMTTESKAFVGLTVNAEWASNDFMYRRVSIMRRTAGPTYTLLNSASVRATPGGEITGQTVYFFGAIDPATDELTVQLENTAGSSVGVSLTASLVRYGTNE